MTKFLLFVAIGIIIYLLFQPNTVEQAQENQLEAKPTPIVIDPPMAVEVENLDLNEEIQKLPVENPAPAKAEKPKSGLSGLRLIGTIYGGENASAMLADKNNTTFIVRLNEKILKTSYEVVRIDKDRIYIKKDAKYYVLVMNKSR